MSARRCSMCGISWPLRPEYIRCPTCDEGTDPIDNDQPISLEEARSLKAHADFELYYAKHLARKDAA